MRLIHKLCFKKQEAKRRELLLVFSLGGCVKWRPLGVSPRSYTFQHSHKLSGQRATNRKIEFAKSHKLLNAIRKKVPAKVFVEVTEISEWAIDCQVKNNTGKLKMVIAKDDGND